MKVEKVKVKHTSLDLRVLNIINTSAMYGSDFDGFKRYFDTSLKEIKTKNSYKPEYCYQCVLTGKKYPGGIIVADGAEVYHLNPSGDRDRLMARITI